jgi:hypothetical protein
MKTDESDNRQRLPAAGFDNEPQIGAAIVGFPLQKPEKGNRGLADKLQ